MTIAAPRDLPELLDLLLSALLDAHPGVLLIEPPRVLVTLNP